MKTAKTLGLCGLFAAASLAHGQVLLVPNSSPDELWALDATTGDVITTVALDFTSTPINAIDGPAGTILLSDQVDDTIYQLDSNGALIGDYITAPIDNIRGIHRFPNGIVGGATTDGIFAWDTNGDLRAEFIDGDFFDVDFINNLIVGASLGDDNVQAYNLGLTLVGQSAPGSIDFPEQVTFARGGVLAVASFSDESVVFVNPDGSIASSFPLRNGGNGRGIYQLPSGNFIVTDNTNGIDEYDSRGNFIRNIASGSSFRFIDVSRNFTP
ncbi:MAG: hypothetical protein ACOC0P_07760 [Planctomycetota bacterium]